MQNDEINYIRSDVLESMPRWETIRDCIAGQWKIKSAREKYLPKPNPDDTSEENSARYDAYLTRALFYNVTGHTKENLLGDAFYKSPVLDAGATITDLSDNINGAGLSIYQQSQAVLGDVLSVGRHGLLVDYPVTDQVATLADLQAGQIRPVIVSVEPENIINWRYETSGGNKTLSLVVIKETAKISGEYADETVDQWRELVLDDGYYRVTVYRQAEGSRLFEIVEGPYYPTDAQNNRLTEIPFFFIGAENNDAIIDKPPMEDIANLNIGHYRNSADYEESCFMVGQPTAVFAGLTERWVKEVMGGNIYLGSRAPVMLPEGGAATLLQANPNQMPEQGMENKLRQMKSIGARLVEATQTQKTATESSLDAKSQHSVLGIIAGNVSAAYTDALQVFAGFVGTDFGASYTLNTDYDLQTISTTERQQLLTEWQAGSITWAEYRSRLRGAGIATEDDESAAESIAASGI